MRAPGSCRLAGTMTTASRANMTTALRYVHFVFAACVAAFILSFAGCATTTDSGAVGVERKQLLLVSSDELNQASAQAYTQLRADATKKGALNTDPALTQRVRAIASRITPRTGVFRADAPGWNWEVN